MPSGDDRRRGRQRPGCCWPTAVPRAGRCPPDIAYTPQVRLRMAQTETRFVSAAKRRWRRLAEARQGFWVRLQREHEPDADRWLDEAENVIRQLTQ